jgi:uncharacterized protein YehS (DUF1456 family)
MRYILNANNTQMCALFEKGGLTVNEPQLLAWLKRDDDAGYQSCRDKSLAHFLNGVIIERRGEKEDGEQPVAEDELNNNIILRKLKIAFDLKAEDILGLLDAANFRMGKAELSAFFRKPGHKHFRECKDQVLRNFLAGLQIKHHG